MLFEKYRFSRNTTYISYCILLHPNVSYCIKHFVDIHPYMKDRGISVENSRCCRPSLDLIYSALWSSTYTNNAHVK